MTCFFIASCDYKFTGGEPISIFCLYRLHCGSYKTRISWCWNPLCLYSSDTSLPPPWTWGHPIWTQDQYQGNLASLFKHQNPQTQPSSHLHGDMWAALCSHFLTFIQQQKNVIISIKIHILKYSKITCKEKQLFQRMRRFQFAIGFWRQGTGQTLLWPWDSVEAERHQGLRPWVGSLLLRMAPGPHLCPPLQQLPPKFNGITEQRVSVPEITGS